MDVMIQGRPVTVRPVTVGDVQALGPAWASAVQAMQRCREEGDHLARLPEVLRSILPCLSRLTGLSPEALEACSLAEWGALIRAACEAQQPPFPTPPPSC